MFRRRISADHASMAFTLNTYTHHTYTHRSTGEDRAAAEMFAKLIFGKEASS
jgi:hypothetical protein